MDEKLQTIYKVTQQIREIVDDECIPLEDLPEAIKDKLREGGVGGSGFTTAFAFSSTNSIAPTSEKMNMSTGLVENLDEGGSQTNTNGTDHQYMSYAIFDGGGDIQHTWSSPVDLNGKNGSVGPKGEKGEKGDKGDPGPQGPQGPAGGGDGVDGYRMQFIYTRVADESVVSTVRPPESSQEDDVPDGWTNNPMGVTPALKVELVSQREKENDVWGDWSDPAIWAMYGKVGRDGNGVEYIYKLTENETVLPGQPVAPAEGDEQYPADWSDDPLSVTPTNTVCWVSTRKQYYVDEKHVWGEYSVPTVGAKYGKDGKEGGGRTIFIYTGSKEFEPSPAIQTPQGGYGDVDTNTLSNVRSTDNYQGDVNPPKKTENTRFIGQSVGSFNSAGNLIGSGSEPFCITGENGTDGADGVSKEFIYRRFPSKEFLQDLKDYLVQNPLENVGTNKVPNTYDSICESICESKWSDEPLGIDGVEYLLEVVCSRKALFDDNGKFTGWGKWSTPTIGAMGGEDGNDGPGVEYIFLVTADTYETNGEIKEMTSDVVLANFIPDLTEMMSHERYQEPEFVPNDDFGYEGYDWTDEPSDIGPNEPMEWVSIRKGEVNQETGEVTWGPFSEPKLGAKYSQDGYAYKTSYVFARGEEVDQPYGGDFQHAYPTVDGTATGERHPDWLDSVPEGTGSIWMSMRTFRSDNNGFDDDWSEPRKMTDTASLQVEFTATDLSLKPGYKPANFGDFVKNSSTLEEAEEAWRKAEEKNDVVWYDDVPNAFYMATAVMHDDVWKDGVVVKIKGEQGDAGKDGTSVEFKGTFATLAKLKAEGDKYVAGDETAFGGSLQMGDGYIIETLGENETFNLYVYSGGKDPDNTTFDANGKGFNIKGEKGDKAVLYIRYSDDGVNFTYPDGTTPGKYVGTLIGHGELDESIVNNPNSYRPWHLWNGEDGWGQEQIFVLTTDKYDLSNPPLLPDNKSSDPEYYPNHNLGEAAPGTTWCDVPQPVSEKYPYCWVATRKGEGNTFGEGKGTEDGYAVLYSRFSYDGNSAHYLELSEDQIVVPLDGERVDPDFIKLYESAPLTVQMSLYAGDDTIENQAKYSINVAEKYASCDPDTGLITIVAAELGSINEIKCTATYNEKAFTKTLYIHKTNAAYELSVNKSVLRRDPYNENLLVPEDQLVKVTVRKWNGSGWIYPDSKLIHATLTKIGGAEDEFVETDHVSGSDNVAEFDFSDETDLAKVRFDVDGTEIFEEIGVIANGEDGVSQEYIYINSKRELTDAEKESLRPNPENLDSEEFQKSDYYPTDVVTELGFAGTDNSLGVSEEVPCEYISSRKKKNGKGGAFSKLSLGARYGEQGPVGPPGENAESTIITQLSNPSAIVQLVDGKFKQTSVSTNIQARKGGEFMPITNISIKGVKLDGNVRTANYYPVSMDYTLDSSKPYDTNPITFELTTDTSKLSIAEHTITVDLNIVINGLNYIETQTILIQKSGGENAVHLELTEDMANVGISYGHEKNGALNISTKAVLYDGLSEATGETYSAEFTDCTGTYDAETGVVTVNSFDEYVLGEDPNVVITASYKGSEYKKTFIIRRNVSNGKLKLDHTVINIDDPKAINGYLEVDGVRGTTFGTNKLGIKYSINDGAEQDVEYNNDKSFTIPTDVVKTIESHITFLLYNEEGEEPYIMDKETIGVVKNGENAQYYQIDANHRGIVKKSDGTVVTPTEAIKPIFQKINGSEFTQCSFEDLTSDGYYVCKSINGEFNATKLTENTLSTIPASVNTQLVYYLFKNSVVNPSAESGGDDYVEIDVTTTEKGDPGESGSNSPVIYSAGEGKSGTTYTGNSAKAPYVYVIKEDNISYYIAYGKCNSDPSNSNNIETATILNGDAPSNKWVKMDNFNAIYADIGVLKQALVGKGVFHGDYMFSQEGVLGRYQDASGGYHDLYIPNGVESKRTGDPCSYEGALNSTLAQYSGNAHNNTIRALSLWKKIENGVWIPNSFFNAKTGDGRLKNVIVEKVDTDPLSNKNKVSIDSNKIRISNTSTNDGVVIQNANFGHYAKNFSFPELDPININYAFSSGTDQTDLYLYNQSFDIGYYDGGAGKPITIAPGTLTLSNVVNSDNGTTKTAIVKFILERRDKNGHKLDEIATNNIGQLVTGGTISNGFGVRGNETKMYFTSDGHYTLTIKVCMTSNSKASSQITFTVSGQIAISTTYVSDRKGKNNIYVGNDAVVVTSDNGYCKMSDVMFESIYGQFGFRINSNGIFTTKSGGSYGSKVNLDYE